MIKRTMSLAITPDTVEEKNVSRETTVKEAPKPKKKTTKRRKKNEDK